MAKVIMIQGTMSGAGKSLITAGLCRLFSREGFKTAPFKSQNMALNSYVTFDGAEIGRAQAMQAEAAGIPARYEINPILLKPTGHTASQVIVNGKSIGDMSAADYFSYKKSLIPVVKNAFHRLSDEFDVIVVEGAGSPAEINLRENDIVNMGLAEILGTKVLLAGDIDRGGVFAQLIGTYTLFSEEERGRIAGFLINKFRGDKKLLDPGLVELEKRTGIPVAGVIPYMELDLEDEDSLTDRFSRRKKAAINISVIKLPYISNFTDMNTFEQFDDVSVNYVKSPDELSLADLIVIPGSKNTLYDLRWMKEQGFNTRIKESADTPVLGICGGFQILGNGITDNKDNEGKVFESGLGMLSVETFSLPEKKTVQSIGRIEGIKGFFSCLNGLEYEGYEIHQGVSGSGEIFCSKGNVLGSYIHGLFDKKEMSASLVNALRKRKGLQTKSYSVTDYREYKERQYDILADTLKENTDMKLVYDSMVISDV